LWPSALGGMAGAALKLDANKIAETKVSAIAKVICSAEAPVECFCRFFKEFYAVSAAGGRCYSDGALQVNLVVSSEIDLSRASQVARAPARRKFFRSRMGAANRNRVVGRDAGRFRARSLRSDCRQRPRRCGLRRGV